MISRSTYRRIRKLYVDQHVPLRRIAVRMSLSRGTVKRWARREHYGPFRRPTRNRVLNSYDPAIAALWGKAALTRADLHRRLKEMGYGGGYTTLCRHMQALETRVRRPERRRLSDAWMHSVLLGKLAAQDMRPNREVSMDDVKLLIDRVRNGRLRHRCRALAVLANLNGISFGSIARFLVVSRRTVRACVSAFQVSGARTLFDTCRAGPKKCELKEYKEAVFALLHAPPREHGINRTTWRIDDIRRILRERGLPICRSGIDRIIKDAGFRVKSARKVLTSTDPDYRKKLESITQILSSLGETERFFSIDEFGPFAVKTQGGRALVGPGLERVVPQWQKSKGSLTIVGALELSTNQVTHFYADHKSTPEMIELLHRLLIQYRGLSRLYLSWDAASWHASRAFLKEVERVNSEDYRQSNGTATVALAPLPSCAQFLNVIESVYSGMAKAIIHNSDYASVEECKTAIDRHFRERNDFYRANPRRAGNKLWGRERETPEFRESNNCKDPRYCR